MSLSTHVLDTAAGQPVPGLAVRCERLDDDAVHLIGERRTDTDGRIGDLVSREDLTRGTYRLTFATGDWAAANGRPMFYPEVSVTFAVTAADVHHHVPLLLSPYGYSTYRGS
jgi:5-hydroxyisourate hydrolase